MVLVDGIHSLCEMLFIMNMNTVIVYIIYYILPVKALWTHIRLMFLFQLKMNYSFLKMFPNIV